jgi:hypothetical protein
MRVLFVEPPRQFWFVMGEYLPPPFGILQLAAYLERALPEVEIEVIDCTAQTVSWSGLAKRIAAYDPDVVAASAFATCNVYMVARALETAKTENPDILTVTGGQHFTATARESLTAYPELDALSAAKANRRSPSSSATRRDGLSGPRSRASSSARSMGLCRPRHGRSSRISTRCPTPGTTSWRIS